MSDFEGTMRGLAFLGSLQGDGVSGGVDRTRLTYGGCEHGIAVELRASTNQNHTGASFGGDGCRSKTDECSSEYRISPADFQIFASPAPASEDALAGTGGGEHPKDNSSPLYLLASEIVDIVEKAEQLRLEEIEAEREGLMTEMSGYHDPAEDVRFA